MNLYEAFEHQINSTRLLAEDDLIEVEGPLIWNGVIFRLPNGHVYSSGQPMLANDKFLIGYVIQEADVPRQILLEEKELAFYEDKLEVVRVVDNIPVLQEIKND